MNTQDNRQWQWWAGEGENPERYTVAASTRGAVIAAGRREFGNDQAFTIVEATQDGPFRAPSFDDDELMVTIFERFSDENSERWNEDGCEDFPRAELECALQAAFQSVLDEHGSSIVTFSFTEQRNKMLIGPLAASDPALVEGE